MYPSITKSSIHRSTILGTGSIWLSWMKVEEVCNLPSFVPHPVIIERLVQTNINTNCWIEKINKIWYRCNNVLLKIWLQIMRVFLSQISYKPNFNTNNASMWGFLNVILTDLVCSMNNIYSIGFHGKHWNKKNNIGIFLCWLGYKE